MDVLKVINLDEVKAAGVIRDVDVLKLRRMFNADQTIDAGEAAELIALHRACATQDPAWTDCFVEMLTDHLVNQSEPEGYVTVENADWLVSSIAPRGRIETKAELELLINVLDKSRWSPQSLTRFALCQVLDAVVDGSGPLRAGDIAIPPGCVTDSDVEVLRRILYAFGGDGNIAVTQSEVEVLFAINDASAAGELSENWRDLFVKAVANGLLSSSGYAAPSREQALAREAWLRRRGDLELSNILGGIFSTYRALGPEEQAIQRLERQKIEIVTGEEVTPVEADWLADLLGRDGRLTPNEIALLDLISSEQPTIHPRLQALVDRLSAAA
jgi:hypothetical protein